jgi:hypothetical protein
MKKTLLKFRWKMWEAILGITGYIFGYGHEVYYGVKDKAVAAYLSYLMQR